MSAAQTQKESGEAGWGCLEALGLSQKELVLAEALQMEYDALSRLKQDKSDTETGQSSSRAPSQTCSKTPNPTIERPRPVPSQPLPAPPGGSLLRGLSGSDPALNQPGGSQSPHPIPARALPLQGAYIKESLYILDSPEVSKFRDSSGSSLGDSPGSGSGFLAKGMPSLPDDVPPAIPPRNPILPSSGSENPFLPSRVSTMPRDVNLFTPDVDPPKVTSGELNYDNINDSLSRLNGGRQGPRGRRANGDQSGKPVARSKTLPPQVPPRTYVPVPKSNKNQRRVSADPVSLGSRMNGFGYELFQVSEERDEEVAAFCHMLDVLRSAYPHSDPSKNCGFVWSPSVGVEELHQGLGVSVKVTVISEHFREPLTFTCDGSSTVDLLIYQTLCYAQDDLDHMDVDDYLLKVCGHDEFLNNSQTLAGLEFVQQCLKFDWDVRLFLTKRSSINTELSRTKEDDETVSTMNHSILLQERPIKQTVTREALTLLLDTFHNEAESFLLSEVELPLHVERLVQSVKALCSSLAAVESPDVTAALNQLPACPCRLQPKVLKDASVLTVRENREKVVEKLTAAILDLVELYCSTFNANFHPTAQSRCCTAPVQEAGLVTNVLSFNVYAAHRIPITWAASYEGFFLSCSLTHGGAELCAPQHTSKQSVSKYLFHLVVWDQRVCFPVQINQLPRESQLTVTLYASSLPPPGGAEEKGKQRRSIEALGWVTMPLFNFRHVLTCGRKLLGLWPSAPGRSVNARTSSPNFSQPDSVILQVDFPTSSFEVRFSTPPPADFCPQYDFSRLDTISQIQLQDVLHKKAVFWLTTEDRRLLWEKKAFCQSESAALPLVLASAPCWEWACLPDIYALLRQWACPGHLDALGLLHASFPDQELRRTAVQWMDSISDPELLDFLPQLVQALKYECYLDSSLVRFLLRRAIGDIRIAHYLFWLLKDNLQDSQFSARYQHLLAALLCCVGRGLREEFDRQCWLVSILAKVAHKVRDTSPSSRQCVLREGLEEMKQFFSVNSSCRLPLNPALLVTGINVQSCSFFNSNAVPLKLSFQNLDLLGDNVNVIFKSGDDLRQDMLTLQVIRIMNKIWIQEGLDMRMVIFKCFSTGRGRGEDTHQVYTSGGQVCITGGQVCITGGQVCIRRTGVYQEDRCVSGGLVCIRRTGVYQEDRCVSGGQVCITGGQVCIRRTGVYQEDRCVSGGQVCIRRTGVYQEDRCVSGGQVCIRRTGVYQEDRCVSGGQVYITGGQVCIRRTGVYQEDRCVSGGQVYITGGQVYIRRTGVYQEDRCVSQEDRCVSGGLVCIRRTGVYQEDWCVSGGQVCIRRTGVYHRRTGVYQEDRCISGGQVCIRRTGVYHRRTGVYQEDRCISGGQVCIRRTGVYHRRTGVYQEDWCVVTCSQV
ncbi:phosphatidylinositol 4-phosphate 3-kinase C2 domain-containing subunit beta isoform X5 [Epinephelus fuscoguttatus]|uniref:phosphatidylinositol 4-phosphate 3-kinase C2 domain-containing subunit beta isoform X5 n=1 Tax=Epinephelus fuscoguttatus TaxID=293821 RepID=UPI0020D0BF85|nr:phosphatidylinositol 4-phosphate 3-kinase C2 domain-containing subunit beta isoform X5 [Epinephelus fuscoguttatus]